ncbi:hypothetical protein EZV62_020802 [Acer yangbiense]|uniref:Pre-nudix hydrolase domain-containing protein n=1 Tax=Acer yangbiense TaxID=1000413 RepID=A0A5C7HH53_9ROSI|nr:hypothetical protein EZV62_020802 [Acer yangbiense]
MFVHHCKFPGKLQAHIFNIMFFFPGQPLKNRVPFLIKNMPTSIEKPETEVQNIELLSSVEDLHGEVTVEIKEPIDSKLFALMLGTSLSHWRQQGKRGVWIKLPIEFSNLVEPAVKEGFRYHRAESDYLMLVKWIHDVGLLDQVDMTHFAAGLFACSAVRRIDFYFIFLIRNYDDLITI